MEEKLQRIIFKLFIRIRTFITHCFQTLNIFYFSFNNDLIKIKIFLIEQENLNFNKYLFSLKIFASI